MITSSLRPRMMAGATHALVVLMVLTTPLLLRAQERPIALNPGARVRLEAQALGPGTTVRRLYVQRGDTLLLVPDDRLGGDTVAVAIADLQQLEVSRGWRRHALMGGLVGLAVGAAGGAAIGSAAYDPESDECSFSCPATRAEVMLTYASGGAQLGALIGVAVGRFVIGDSWERVLPARTRVGVAPAPGGRLSMGVSVPFR